ncbi:MAG: prolipoprotein diacylglyceryl transferase family protein [Myxococcota bacterium]|nr:prolipoprotein diacylglyceryl transferase family protein [Myxococcota bacterium]
MHPYLLTLPNGTQIPTWGLIISATVLGVIWLGHTWVKRDGGYPKDLVFDTAIIIFVMHTIGGRIGFLRANWDEFRGDWSKIFDLTAGGSAFFESFLGITAVLAVYLWWRKIPIMNLFDLIGPLVAVGQTVGRSACIFAGCCFGKPIDAPWGFVFEDPGSLVADEMPALLGVPLHPVQIYEILATGLLAALLIWRRPHRRFRGEIALLYLTISPILRFFTDFFRGDPKRGWFMEDQLGQMLSMPQGVALGMLAVMVLAWYVVPRLPGADNLSPRGNYGGSEDSPEADSRT